MRNKLKEICLGLLLGVLLPVSLGTFIVRENRRDDPAPSTYVIISGSTAPSASQTAPSNAAEAEITVLVESGDTLSLSVETYLTRVVLAEMPGSFSPEALRAQAVVARTYTMRKKQDGGKHPSAVVCTDPGCCQGYITEERYLAASGSTEIVEKINRAVKDTGDLVLTYDGQLIDAVYFSCSGGRTEDAVAVWGADVPYLQSVESPGEEKAAHYTDTVVYSLAAVRELLGLDEEVCREGSAEILSYTDGGGVKELNICGSVFQGTELRRLLNLRSTAFQISIVGQSVVVTTKGFGHRVGMSQYGAEAMAASGSSFQEILEHYYAGAVLTELDGK